jgi:Na+/H+ antiporter NhaD/arsenite permease-like protein
VRRALATAILVTTMTTAASTAVAAGAVDGAKLSLGWAFPFVGMLLSIAVLPLLAASFWHHHYGKVAAFWALVLLIPYAFAVGPASAAEQVAHTVLAEYVPFLLLLVALFTATGGIYIKGNLHGSPVVNTTLLAVGTVFASVMGTTGASMLMIRPLLRANDARRHRTHVVIFFIFLVANIGGALTPLGDPPLFLGFLKGVDFFWTTKAMFAPTLASVVILLGLFFLIDTWYFNRPDENRARDPSPDSPLRLEGWINFLLFGPMILCAVLFSGVWNPGVTFNVFGTELELQNIVRDLWLVAIIWASLRFTPAKIRHSNHFEWGPMIEVAKLFAGIFLTIIPVIAILRAGQGGAMAPLVGMVTHPDGSPNNAMYFWATGILSSFLDNAPTYLVFFNMAGGDAERLMGPLGSTLVAISAGAVFMGANTYIGNAPNFMVRSVAVSRRVHMPSFFGYMLWSGLILLPVFGLLTFLFFK